MEFKTYILTDPGASDREGITCRLCRATSFHPEDVRSKYCSQCGIFHDDHVKYLEQIPYYTTLRRHVEHAVERMRSVGYNKPLVGMILRAIKLQIEDWIVENEGRPDARS